MKKILMLAKYGHDLNYFRSIKNYIDSRKQNKLEIDIIFNLPIFFFELFKLFSKLPIKPEEMAEILKYEISRKMVKHPPLRARLYNILVTIIARFYYFKYKRILEVGEYSVLCIWGGFHVAQKMAILSAKELNIKVFHFENGFLPDTTVMDFKGTNFANSVPRDFNFYTAITTPFNKKSLIPRENVIKINTKDVILPEKYIFCPFQVALDTQILVHSPWVKNMEHFYEILSQVSKKIPQDLYFVIKQHPSCFKNYPELHTINNSKIIFANHNNTESLIEGSQAVITVNSSVGMEAIMLNKKVITLGNAFYSGYGFAKNLRSVEEIEETLNKLDDWKVDQIQTEKFLSYLQNFYLIPKNYKNLDASHLEAVYQKLL
jgi:capsular polysaccharide export protein